ncbi:MAG: DUF2059 domain-containing protein [Myxococcota bacterium]
MNAALPWLSRLVVPLLLVVPGGCTKKGQTATTAPCLVTVPTQLDPATKRQDALHLLELTGAAEVAKQVMDPLFDTLQRSITGVPPEFWDKVRVRFDMNELKNQIADIYVEELSHEDIAALVAFYESSNGRRFTASLPSITSKSQKIGQAYGERVAREVIDEIIKAGYMPAQPPG